MTDARAVALDLAKRLPVFPCDNDKRPFTAHGFKDASNDPDLIRTWWTRWPNADRRADRDQVLCGRYRSTTPGGTRVVRAG